MGLCGCESGLRSNRPISPGSGGLPKHPHPSLPRTAIEGLAVVRALCTVLPLPPALVTGNPADPWLNIRPSPHSLWTH